MKVEFFKHSITEKDWSKVYSEVASTPFLTTGPMCKKVEDRLAEMWNVKRVVLVGSCTAALHLTQVALNNIYNLWVETACPAFTFVATSNSVIYSKTTPNLIDVNYITGLMKLDKAIEKESNRLIPVKLYGQNISYKECLETWLKKLENFPYVKDKIEIIEDSAHSLEAPSKEANAACYSFYATKMITCGEGGAVATNDENLADELVRLRLHGLSKSAWSRYQGNYKPWGMEILGYKYNLTDIQAGILNTQLDKWPVLKEERHILYSYYTKKLQDEGISYFNIEQTPLMMVVKLDPKIRNKVIDKINNAGIGVAVNWLPVHEQPYYKETFQYRANSFPNSHKLGQSVLSLPFYPGLKREEIIYIVQTLVKSIEEAKNEI